MALAKVTIESLLSMRQTMKKAWSDIVDIKLEVDHYCYNFEWNDPVGRNFVARYEEGMAPVKEKLLPMLEQYADYLEKLRTSVEEFSETPHIHIAGGEDIVSILPKGTPTDPIVLNPDATVKIPDRPQSEIDMAIPPVEVEKMDMDAVYAELSPEQRSTFNKLKKEILERKEKAEYQIEIAKINSFWDADFDTPQHVRNKNWSIMYEAKKEIQKADEDLKELEEMAREGLRNLRNRNN